MPPTCSARSCTTSTASATARSTRRRRRSTLLNPDVNVVTYDTRLDASNIIDIITGYDVIVDGADNFPSRYLLNDASVKLGIPVVHGSIFRFEGMVSVFHPLRRPDVPRHGARAAAGRAGPELRRGRRARRAARHRRQHPGARGDQGAARPRRAADRAHPVDRHHRHELPHVQAAAPTRPTRSPTRTATASSCRSSRASAPPASPTDARLRTISSLAMQAARCRQSRRPSARTLAVGARPVARHGARLVLAADRRGGALRRAAPARSCSGWSASSSSSRSPISR